MSAASARRRARGLKHLAGPGSDAPVGTTVQVVRRRLVEVGGSWLCRARLAAGSRPGRDEGDHACLLEAVARGLRSGQSMIGALGEAAEAEAERGPGVALARSVRLADSGLGVGAVVEDWVASRPSGARVLAGTALALGAELGGAQARALDAAAASLRERASLEREVRALSSQARASAGVMVLAPLVFAVFSGATNPRVAQVLTSTPLGWACLLGGLLLDGAGAGWMARLARRIR
jgi:tight adherence protein B